MILTIIAIIKVCNLMRRLIAPKNKIILNKYILSEDSKHKLKKN